MTVIVTPCLLLIGNNTKNPKDEHLEWSLEDEYEYRRRKFYYRCAGIGNWYFSDADSDDDDDDYQLTANSDFDSGYILPPKEEWAIEKRHWLDLLNQHRATALDKWIRTAADTKQAVGDVYGYRALMSALCSDRIQDLREAWTTLRRLHTATAVAFESRLRPEFLGRRDKHTPVGGVEAVHDFNEDNDVDLLLQLPPNATVPDATALAVLYEHLYNDADYDATFSITNANDKNTKEDKNPRPSSLFTSPLLLSPSPWSSPNSGISSGLGASLTADYGLQALHILCIQYSEWVQQSYTKKMLWYRARNHHRCYNLTVFATTSKHFYANMVIAPTMITTKMIMLINTSMVMINLKKILYLAKINLVTIEMTVLSMNDTTRTKWKSTVLVVKITMIVVMTMMMMMLQLSAAATAAYWQLMRLTFQPILHLTPLKYQ